MFLVVGLGNIGLKYSNNRHNVGFMVVDYLIHNLKSTKISNSSFKGELYKSEELLLLKPSTYMNLSGESVLAVYNLYKPSKVIVIHDDIDLDFGVLKFKIGGGHGGHNGLKSIDLAIGKEYIRVRIGVGRPKSKEEVSNYVLSNFTEDEKKFLQYIIENVSKATIDSCRESIDRVSSKFSTKSLKDYEKTI